MREILPFTPEQALWVISATSGVVLGLACLLVAVLLGWRLGTLRQERRREALRQSVEPGFLDALRRGDTARVATFYRPDRELLHVLGTLLLQWTDARVGQDWQAASAAYQALGLADRDIRRLEARFWWTRTDAARNLGRVRCAFARDPLLARLGDRSPEVRLMAAWALGRIGDPSVLQPCMEVLLSSSHTMGMRLCSTVFEWGARAVEPLCQALEDPDPEVRRLALHLLAEVGGAGTFRTGGDGSSRPDVVSRVVGKTRPQEHKEVRIAAFKALGTLGDPAAGPVLMEGLKDETWEIRAQAARGLGRCQVQEAIPLLADGLWDPQAWVRHNAGQSLTLLGPEGRRALLAVYHGAGGPGSATRRRVPVFPAPPPVEALREGSGARAAAAHWLDELEVQSSVLPPAPPGVGSPRRGG